MRIYGTRRWSCKEQYNKTEKLGWKENHTIQITGIKDSQGDTMVDQKLPLKLWKNYITELYDLSRNQGDLGRETTRLYVVPEDEHSFSRWSQTKVTTEQINETGQWSQYFNEVTMTELLPLKQTVLSCI